MTNPTSFRFSDMTSRQIEWLVNESGLTRTEVVSIAIDRMFQKEFKMSKRIIPQVGHKVQHVDGPVGTVIEWIPEDPEWGGGYMRVQYSFTNPQGEQINTVEKVELARFMSGQNCSWSNYQEEIA